MTKKYKINRWIRETSRKLRVVKDLGGKCSNCGKDGMAAPWTMDIHHIDPSKKELAPNKMYDYPYKVIQKELENCMLLCSNCHREHHNKPYLQRYEQYKTEIDKQIELTHLDFRDELNKQMDIDVEVIRPLVLEGKSFRQISKLTGFSVSKIHRCLKKANLKPSYNGFLPGKVTPDVLEKIKMLKHEGKTSREIGKELNLSKTSVLNHWDLL